MSPLVQALAQLGPREARLLARAGLEGASTQALAAAHGISPEAASVGLFRAARRLAAALEQAPCPPLPDAAEAVQVAAFLRGEGAAAKALARLAAEGQAVHEGQAAARAAAAGSGRQRLETALRWLAILGILGVSLWSLRG
jgi:HPt (histidine-containing phosphotransfer) domain-containing protein